MLKAQDYRLKAQDYRSRCQNYCSVFWILAAHRYPIQRYEKCISKCIRESQEIQVQKKLQSKTSR